MTDLSKPPIEDGADNDTRGPLDKGPIRKKIEIILIIAFMIVLAIFTGMLWKKDQAKPVSDEVTVNLKPVEYAEPKQTAEEKAEEDKRVRQMVMEGQVRDELCQDLAKRYLAAKSSVELARNVQLSQANQCGWRAIMENDAETHDFTPEALAVAKKLEEGEVTSVDGAAGLSDKIDRLQSKVNDVQSDVNSLKYRIH